jgi:acetate kinase
VSTLSRDAEIDRISADSGGTLVGVVNAGSSSLKFAFYDGENRVLSGQMDGLGVRPSFKATDAAGATLAPVELEPPPTTPAEALSVVIGWAKPRLGGRRLEALGHRVVHGGAHYAQPQRVTPELLAELESLVPLAPLHEPHNLAPIRAALALRPDLPQVACFDTAFHRTMPEVAQTFALPRELTDSGIRRYGFHGLSYEYIASVLPDAAPEIAGGRVIVAHLGNGASLCALRAGRSIATTMGFTALDGLAMGTRCGDLDPGIILHLIQQKGMSAEAVEELLYKKSGVLGVSGVSSDFRDLLASRDSRARLAIELFCYRVAGHIAALASALGGLDGIVFTAGVGENAAAIRADIGERCRWMGLTLDDAANRHHGPRISTGDSRIAAYVIPTDENLMIARHARALLAAR